MKKASETYLKGILAYSDDEVVSTDFIHDAHSSIFDSGSGIELSKKFFKLVSCTTTSGLLLPHGRPRAFGRQEAVGGLCRAKRSGPAAVARQSNCRPGATIPIQ